MANEQMDQDAIAAQWEASLDSEDPAEAAKAASENELSETMVGANLYSVGSAIPAPDAKSTVRQGYIEKSNVNSVAEMTHMVEVMRSYTAVANLLQQQSDLHKSAIEKLADVPA